MSTNTLQTPTEDRAAMVDRHWLDDDEKQIIETDFSNLMFTFSPKDAARLGLGNLTVSLGYIEYLSMGTWRLTTKKHPSR